MGAYIETAGVVHGFLLRNGVFSTIDFPEPRLTDPTGINPGGTIVGVYNDAAGNGHGFVRTP